MGLLTVLLLAPVWAADVDGYQPSSSLAVGQGTLQAESATLPEEGAAGALIAGFVQDPVVREYARDGYIEPLVSALVPVTIYGGYTIGDRVRLDAFLPTYAHVQAPVTGYQGAAMGDLRLQGVINLHQGRQVAVGLLPRLELPTGTRDALTRRGATFGAHLLLNGETADATVGWVANLGLTGAGNDPVQGRGMGSSLDVLTGLWWRPEGAFRVGAEADLHAGLAQGPSGANQVGSTHLFAQQVLSSGWALTVAGGTGLIGGIGAPEYRAVAAVSFGARLPDADGDGLIGDADLCPDDPEDADGFEDADGCPEIDNDGDGVVDADDRCPLIAEDVDGFEDTDGCVDPDNDGDGITDADDACPDKKGAFQGCPDSDLDGLPDHQDACPDRQKPEKERKEFADGCPKPVYFDDFSIAHERPVRFESGTTALTRRSEEVLTGVLGLLLSHPEVAKLEVQVSVDSSGGARAAQRLSEQRADAVVAWFVERSIDPQILVAAGKGIGEDDVIFKILAVDRRRTGATPAPTPDPTPGTGIDPDGSQGLLTVVITGGLEGTVWVDGKRLLRAAPFTDIPIAPGTHEIRVTNLREGIDDTQTLTVRNGEFVRVVVDNPNQQVPQDIDLDDIWKPVRPPQPVIDVERGDDEPASGKRPPRSSKKR